MMAASFPLAATDSGTLLSLGIGLVAVLLTAAGIIGTWLALRVSRNTQVVTNYKAAADAWQARAVAQGDEIKGLQESLEETRHQNTELQAKVNVLQDLVTGRHAVDELSDKMDMGFERIAIQIRQLRGEGTR